MRKCENCDFWAKPEDLATSAGECRIRAPRVGPDGEAWPPTVASDWCGEFEPVDISKLPVDEQPNFIEKQTWGGG